MLYCLVTVPSREMLETWLLRGHTPRPRAPTCPYLKRLLCGVIGVLLR